MCHIELHSHTDKSNLKLLDSTNFVEDLIQKSADMGKKGVSITDHETVAAHVQAIQVTRRLKEEGKIPQDFKLILGNEIYLVDSLEEVRDNYEGGGVTKFPHFLLLAKDRESHEILRDLSSKAWGDSFWTGIMERTPTIKENLEKAIRNNPQKLIGASACLGSESSIHILNGDYDKAKEFLKWCSDLFGEDHFYLELQPGRDGEQRIVNEKLVEFSSELGLELIITSDTHYLRPEDADIHEAFLNADDGEREVKAFYSNTYLHTKDEIFDKLSYLDEEVITKALQNTLKIGDMIEDYTIESPTIIPKIELPEFEVKHLFKQGYDQYDYISKMAHSDSDQDRYLIYLVEKGFIESIPYKTFTKERFHEYIARIDVELGELWEISVELQQSMSSYYVTVQELISIIWADDCGEDSKDMGSLVGSGRGSASGFLINYLLRVTQIDPLSYGVEMPHWRHLHKSRGDIGALDIDIDVAPHLRPLIFQRMRDKFGEDRVLQVATFGTEGSRSALQTACRGLGYDVEIGRNLGAMIPFSRGESWSIHDCIYGNEKEDRAPIQQFINEIDKYPKLKETALKIAGLTNKRSIHAGGVILTNENFIKTNALMRAPNGTPITQFNLDDTQAMGSIKFDVLGVNNISKLQLSLELLLEEEMIEWQGTLRKTFNKYFHPDNMNLENPRYYELLGQGEIPDLFQFDTQLANQALITAKPTNLIEMAAVNSLMRLMGDGNETPVETFTRFKNDIDLWYEEMKNYKLNGEEIKIMEEFLLPISGISETQEIAMMLSMDERIAGLDVTAANRLRKAIARKNEKAYEAVRKEFYDGGAKMGTRKELLDYVWLVQVGRQRGYSFSILHTIAYSIIGIQNISVVADYSPVIWHTACLTINSGSLEVEEGQKSKSTAYGKVANAIAETKEYGIRVELPLINSANFGFTPDVENERIIFSLKGINGIGDDIAHEIIKNRPYISFDDFHERMYLTKKVQRAHTLKLIKAGAFNEFDTPIEIMKQFIVKEVVVRDSLNGQNMSRIVGLGLLDTKEYSDYRDYFNFRRYLMSNVHEIRKKPNDKIFIIEDDYSQAFFESNFSFDNIIENKQGSRVEPVVVGEHNGKLLISEKAFNRQYDEKMLPVTELYTDRGFLRKFNIAQFYEIWNKEAVGTTASWEMESVSFYSDKHELDNVDFDRYGIKDFNKLPETPVVVGEYEYRGQTRYNYELSSIVGTVLDRNDNNNTVTLLTPTGVTTIKTWSGRFNFYNKQIKKNNTILEKSWFTRGEKILVTGYRSNDLFILNAPKGSHTVNKITEIRNDRSLGLQSERARS